MNIQQFQYVLAVADLRHFELSAEKCFITQSTLSTMISKFEDEIGIKIFDRKKKPVEITTEGEAIIEQLKVITREIDQLKELTKEIKGEIKGSLTISVIPTIAPFLLPLFLQNFASRFPNLNIEVKEQTTGEIIRQIKSRELDIGILSIPLQDRDLLEIELYDEPFVYYDASAENARQLVSGKLDMSNLCLLEEGHCMRTQVINLCDLHKKPLKNKLNFDYKAGSIDSLLRFVKVNGAATLLPYLSTLGLTEEENKHISGFVEPVPYRSVGLVVHRHFVKKKILENLQNEITDKIKPLLPQKEALGKKLSPV
ncbi:MAG TPA: DNA-binding transcriptional regulator OxyR [Cytophagales bacterium]|jgi:LysR family hydrogen peroxide-inducible transcriptional activator|nr:DNA-binding transcriptional regulator OxyR [Cytophagales bacterium]